MRFKPQEGLEVMATGRLTTFPGKSTYQIVVEAIEPAGIGALMALLEERKKKLAAEGLFAEARKRPPPFLPPAAVSSTSPTGPGIPACRHAFTDRFPPPLLFWPCRGQGEMGAAARGLPRPQDLLGFARQRFDSASGRLRHALRSFAREKRGRLVGWQGRLDVRLIALRAERCQERLHAIDREMRQVVRRLVQQ